MHCMTKAQIVMQITIEQEHVLQDEGEVVSQLPPRQLPDVDAVDLDRSLLELVEPRQQLQDSRLAGSGRSIDGDQQFFFHGELRVYWVCLDRSVRCTVVKWLNSCVGV